MFYSVQAITRKRGRQKDTMYFFRDMRYNRRVKNKGRWKPMFSVLAAAGTEELRSQIYECAENGGYHCYPADTAEKALFLLDSFHIDLLICEDLPPHLDACRLVSELRQARYQLPVLIIANRADIEEKRQCFQAGCDDCMIQPIDFEELLLRVAALMRRAHTASAHQLQIGELTLDYDALTVASPQGVILLPKKELRLLFKLLSAPNRTFTRQQLVEELWGLSATVDERTVDVHIKRLREKFRCRPEFRIVTVRGVGYRVLLMD